MYIYPKKKEIICSNTDEAQGHYTKRIKLNRGRQVLYELTYMWNLKKTNSQKQKTYEVFARGWGVGERCKNPIIRLTNSEYVLCIMLTTVNSTILHI